MLFHRRTSDPNQLLYFHKWWPIVHAGEQAPTHSAARDRLLLSALLLSTAPVGSLLSQYVKRVYSTLHTQQMQQRSVTAQYQSCLRVNVIFSDLGRARGPPTHGVCLRTVTASAWPFGYRPRLRHPPASESTRGSRSSHPRRPA